jgi:hypothetical protein
LLERFADAQYRHQPQRLRGNSRPVAIS